MKAGGIQREFAEVDAHHSRIQPGRPGQGEMDGRVALAWDVIDPIELTLGQKADEDPRGILGARLVQSVIKPGRRRGVHDQLEVEVSTLVLHPERHGPFPEQFVVWATVEVAIKQPISRAAHEEKLG